MFFGMRGSCLLLKGWTEFVFGKRLAYFGGCMVFSQKDQTEQDFSSSSRLG